MSTKKTSDITEWYAAQYLAATGVGDVEGGGRFKTFMKGFPALSLDARMPHPITGKQRMSNFLSLKLRYPLGPDGYTCSAMTAMIDTVAAHYAYAYWRRGREQEDPEYICIGPTYDSRDGEYRPNFIRYPIFVSTYELMAKTLSEFEEGVLDMVAGGDLELKSVIYPESAAEHIIDRDDQTRLPVVTFAVALLMDLWETERDMLMAHTSKSYVSLMKSVLVLRPELVKQSTKCNLTDPRVVAFTLGHASQATVQCGQKLVPMFTREAMQFSDYNLAAWRELAVGRVASDLVLNFISPSFSLYNQWAYIEGADAALFENPAMKDRYKRGHAIEEASRSLRESRQHLNNAKSLQNYHTEELDALIYESLEYAQSYLTLSPVALAHTMEHVGRALPSVGAYARRSPALRPTVEDVFASRDSVACFLFEFAYAAHCLHTKVGAAHTDLHSNNLTLYTWGAAADLMLKADTIEYRAFYDNPVVAYIAGTRGEADTYVFPATGISGCLIDYSRCILGPAFRPHLEEGRSPQYAINFYRDQVNRVMRTLYRYAPTYVEKNQEAIKASVLANFDAVFPVLCAVDFIAVGRSVAATLLEAMTIVDNNEIRPFEVSQAGVDLATQLEHAARELFITGLHDLAESAGARRGMRIPLFPGETLLEKVFGEWLFPRWVAADPKRARSAQLVDVYNYNNKLRYNGDDYAKYPPWARFDEIEQHLGEHKLTDLFERGIDPFLDALQPGARIDIISEQVRSAQEKLDGTPVSTMSSWLDE